MPHRAPRLTVVSPPMMQRSGFDALNHELAPSWGAFRKGWLKARFEEGLHIRMMTAPCPAYIAFFSGGSRWHLIDGDGQAIVVQAISLPLAKPEIARSAVQELWDGVECFARHYDFSSILLPVGQGAGLSPVWIADELGLTRVDHLENEASLYACFVNGPAEMPRFKCGLSERRRALGQGLVVQDCGMTERLSALSEGLIARAAQIGLAARHDLLRTARDVEARGATVAPVFGVYLDGSWLGGAETPPDVLWHKVQMRAQSPS